MFRPTLHHNLLGDPGVTVTMSDGEKVKVEPRDFRDRPEKKKSLQLLLKLLKDDKDWENLPTFLGGMRMAKEALPPGYLERFVRRAFEQGHGRIITRCIEQVDITDVTLADPPVTKELMMELHERATKAGFQGAEMGKIVQEFKHILALMQKSEHCGQKAFKKGFRDMRQDPTVLGLMLALRASGNPLAENSILIESVQMIAARILAICTSQDLAVSEDQYEARQQMEGWLPVLAGIKLALKTGQVEDPMLQTGLTQLRDRLEKAVEQAGEVVRAAAKDQPRRCLQMYDEMKGLEILA